MRLLALLFSGWLEVVPPNAACRRCTNRAFMQPTKSPVCPLCRSGMCWL